MNKWCQVLGGRNLHQTDSLYDVVMGKFYMNLVMCVPRPFKVVLINQNCRNRSLYALVPDSYSYYAGTLLSNIVGTFLSDIDIQRLMGVNKSISLMEIYNKKYIRISLMEDSFQLSNTQNIYTTPLEILQCLNRPASKFNTHLKRCNELERGEIEIFLFLIL
jgi:hypothetical protein